MPWPTRFREPSGCLRQGSVLLTCLFTTLVVHFPAYAQADGSCPLTVKQEVAAVKAFKKFAPIFREPRCVNCHGAVNPFAENGGHPEQIDIREEAQDAVASELKDFVSENPLDEEALERELNRLRQVAESPEQITDNDVIRGNAFIPMHQRCQECHITAWIIPFSEHHFVNKSDEELCLQLKRSEDTKTADRFLQHMQTDELVLAGFKGTRGLQSPVTPIPPGMPFATLEKYVNDWVEAMDGKFHKPPDCGCKIHGLVLQIQHRIDTNLRDEGFKAGQVEFSGAVDFAVRLETPPNMPEGWFYGQASVVRPISVHHVRPDCTGKSAPRPETWDVRAIMDEEGKFMRFIFSIDYEDPSGTLTCRPRGMTTTMAITGSLFGMLSQREDMKIPTTAEAKVQFRAKMPGTRESLTVTVLQRAEPK